jgi:hypothetical protein
MQKKRNKTFRNGPRQHLNACIGENSGADNRNGYALGFGDAVKVMLTAATHEQYVDSQTGQVATTYMDALIYPICFCARHHIELFLKREIHNISQIRGKCRPVPMNHNLESLWVEFRDVCKESDRRLYSQALLMEEFILDYAEIDPTGETFRYAQNRKNKEHLTEMGGVINVEVLGQRFDLLSNLIENFEVASVEIVREYGTGTYTTKLSRAELFELTRQLPPRSEWQKSEKFDTVRQEFRKKYDLSSNDFQRAVRKIEAHPLLSEIIGVELPILSVDADLVDRLHAIYVGNALFADLSNDEWAAVDAIYQIGRLSEYPEYYEIYMREAKSGLEDGRLSSEHSLREVLYPNRRFGTGLQKLGQIKLFKKFETLFPK